MSKPTILKVEPSMLVSVEGEQVFTTSLQIAEIFSKRHDDVLKAISRINCSEEFHARNFAVCFKNNKLQNGKPQKYYQITRDGFTILGMGFTGKKAMAFKEAYINAFNEMEAKLREPDIDTRLNILTECNHKVASIENHYQSQLIEQQHKLIAMTTEAYQLAKAHIKLLNTPKQRANITINLDETRPDRFIKQVQNVLKLYPNLNKTQLLKECGYEKTDKTARKWLDVFEGQHWYCSKRSGVYTYNLNVEDLEVLA